MSNKLCLTKIAPWLLLSILGMAIGCQQPSSSTQHGDPSAKQVTVNITGMS
jgi:hypothetical protein